MVNSCVSKGTEASHGFSPNHRCDDYLEDVEYRSLRVVEDGVFPDIPPTRDGEGTALGSDEGTLVYMRWELSGEDRMTFRAGKRYAFMVGIQEPGRERRFSLANHNAARPDASPSLTDDHDAYHGGWGLRREGDGTLPPTMIPGAGPSEDAAEVSRLIAESLFAPAPDRYALSPTTDGFPDVDTYRDHEFYLEATPIDSSGDPR